MTLGLTVVDVAVAISVHGLQINLVQVRHRFQILERDGICFVGLFREEEFLCTGAQIGFQFGHLEAFVLVAVEVLSGCARIGVRPVLIEADKPSRLASSSLNHSIVRSSHP